MVPFMRVDSGLPPFLWGRLMMAAPYICNRISYSAPNIETPYKKLYEKDADLSHLKIIGVRVFVHMKNPNKLGHTPWEEMMCGLSETESNSYRIWNPKTHRVVENKNVVFIETQQNVLPATRRLSPQQGLESPSYDFSDDTLDDNYVSHNGMLRDMQNYTSALDFGVDTPAGTTKFLLPQQASPDVTSLGGASPAISPSRGVTQEESSTPSAPAPAPARALAPAPGPAPTPTSAAPRAINGRIIRGTVSVMPAVTRSRAASLLPVHAATRHGRGRNNNRATLVKLFEAGTLQRLSELDLGPLCYTEGIAHQAEKASFNVEYAYVATNALGSFSGLENQGKNYEHLQGGDDPPTSSALGDSFRQGDRESGGTWHVRAGTHHFNSERRKSRRHPLGIQDQGRGSKQGPSGRAGVVTSPRNRLRRHLCPRVQTPEHPDGTCNRRGAGLRGLHAGRANNISQR